MKQTIGSSPAGVGLRIAVASLLAVVSAAFVQPGFCDEASADGVTVRRNSDGSVDVFDQDDPVMAGGGATPAGSNGGNVDYVPGTSPYTKKYSDGTVVRRNADGSIETFSPPTVRSWGPSQPRTSSSSHKRASRKTHRRAKRRHAAVKKPAVRPSSSGKTSGRDVIIRRSPDGSLKAINKRHK